MLVILGGNDLDRAVFRTEGRGNWSSAFPLVLEKYGWLEFEVAGPEALADLEDAGCAIIGRLPDSAWTSEACERIAASPVPVFVDGPLPPGLAARLGLTTAPLPPEGTIAPLTDDVIATATRLGAAPGGKVRAAIQKPVARDSRLDWQAIGAVPITAQQSAAWGAAGWDAERWTFSRDADELLAKWSPGDGSSSTVTLARFGNVVVSSFGLLAFLGQMHTSEPSEPGMRRASYRSTSLETLFGGVLELLHRLAGRPLLRVLPWPAGHHWALNVRHDFDRALDVADVEHVLAGHQRAGTAATWYWRSRHLPAGRFRRRNGADVLRRVAQEPNHEIAHHTELLWTEADREQQLIERALGARILGTSAHGDPDCFRYQGAPNVLWCEHRNLEYTELIQHAHAHPHRFATLDADGAIRPLRPICLPHHESFDLSTTQGDTNADAMPAAAERFAGLGGMLQVMNHPDLHPDALFDTLSALPKEGRLDWTAAQAADWWRRTHSHDRLTVTLRPGGDFVLRAQDEVRGLTVETRRPDGSATTHTADVAPEAVL